MTRRELANILFPDITTTIDDLESRYPARNLPTGAEVTRFAPSPTGFLHTGSLFTAMISAKVAAQSGGVFYVRLEDTDTKREVAGTGKLLLDQLKVFNIIPNEGYLGDDEKGNYGPYAQSERANIYKTVIKQMIIDDLAYPCFVTPEQLETLRKQQEVNKEMPGYYGKYAISRFLSVDEAVDRINSRESWVIRFKSPGNHERKISATDLIRGQLELSENDQDTIILKGDGLPTYHFAHVVDDHFMHTTIVSRGEEWLSSLPIHLQMFAALGWSAPAYAHLPVINKLDDGKKRKLSKRKDPEAAVSFFIEEGYPPEALLTYLLSIANSNFEEWWSANRNLPLSDFPFVFTKMSLDGALFDLDKVRFFAKEYIAALDALTLVDCVCHYAEQYQPDFARLINEDRAYFTAIVGIERGGEKPRKDFVTYKDVYPMTAFFFAKDYQVISDGDLPFSSSIENEILIKLLTDLKNDMDVEGDESEWFANLKLIGEHNRFAPNGKTYKKAPELYHGHIGDVAEALRICLTGSKQSPNLYLIIKVLGIDEVKRRIAQVIEKRSRL